MARPRANRLQAYKSLWNSSQPLEAGRPDLPFKNHPTQSLSIMSYPELGLSLLPFFLTLTCSVLASLFTSTQALTVLPAITESYRDGPGQ